MKRALAIGGLAFFAALASMPVACGGSAEVLPATPLPAPPIAPPTGCPQPATREALGRFAHHEIRGELLYHDAPYGVAAAASRLGAWRGK